MRNILAYILLIYFAIPYSHGQDKYMIFFTDKDGVEADHQTYFSKKAIERRKKIDYPLDHISDRPLNQNYVSQIENVVQALRYELRWPNAVTCIATDEQITQIKHFPFVRHVRKLSGYQLQICDYSENLKQGEYKLARAQIERMGGEKFKAAGYTGKGVRIAILDAGFPNVDWLPVFSHIRDRGGIIATKDFLHNKPDAYRGNKHGTMVLSNIAGIADTVPLGMAPDAEFLLARTEALLKEGLADEESWLAAVEWADKNGADIINSSLGYTKRLYMRKDMDGTTSLITKSANMAASKGILVVNSAGNEGSDAEWVTIGAPADADSVLAVGGINPWTNMHASWSSFGPSYDKRLKPNICAYGHAVVAGPKSIREVTGTSFASPLTAGFAACVWQMDTTLTNMELFKKLEQSGDLYPYFDYAHGYGVPQADYFLHGRKKMDTTFHIKRKDSTISIKIVHPYFGINTLHMSNYYSNLENILPGVNRLINGDKINIDNDAFIHHQDYYYNSNTTGIFPDSTNYFLYHVENDSGYLDVYFVIGVEQPNVLNYRIKPGDKGKTIRFYYKGYTAEYKIE